MLAAATQAYDRAVPICLKTPVLVLAHILVAIVFVGVVACALVRGIRCVLPLKAHTYI